MTYRLLADALVVLHFAFIAFVVAGALLVARRPKLAWLHLPAVAWGAFVETTGRVCPLTPWEQALRVSAGQAGYTGSFIEEYLVPIVYPDGLTHELQVLLGAVVVLVNVLAYLYIGLRGLARA